MVETLSLFPISCTGSSHAVYEDARESRFFTLRNAAALSSLISTPSVPWLYSWQTNASASAKTLSSGGQCSPRWSMSFDELSKIFKADCLQIPANWLVVSQPVMEWKASSEFIFSSGSEILWTGIYLFVRDVPENIQSSWQLEILSVLISLFCRLFIFLLGFSEPTVKRDFAKVTKIAHGGKPFFPFEYVFMSNRDQNIITTYHITWQGCCMSLTYSSVLTRHEKFTSENNGHTHEMQFPVV